MKAKSGKRKKNLLLFILKTPSKTASFKNIQIKPRNYLSVQKELVCFSVLYRIEFKIVSTVISPLKTTQTHAS